MMFDILLPIVIFFIASISVLSYKKFEKKITSLFEETKLNTRQVVLIVISMGLMVTVMVFIPAQAIQIIFIASYSYMMFSYAYIALRKWYMAVLPPILFVLLYLYYWELAVFNLFVAIFAIIVPIYLGAFFSWKTTWIFAILLTILDVVQVFGTGFMGQYANKMIELKLPVMLILPTYPSGGLMGLGLGDLFLAGLLAVQTALKQGQKAGILVAATIGIAMFVFEVVLFNTELFTFFPATVVVIAGWVMGIVIARGLIHVVNSSKRDIKTS